MATHSSVLAWRIPWTEEPGGYSPWGHKESDTVERLSTHTMYKSKRNDFEIIAWSDKHGILGITALGGLGLMIGTYWWKGTPLQKQQTCYEGGVAAPGVRKGCSWVGSKLEA